MEIRNIWIILILMFEATVCNICKGKNPAQTFDWTGPTAVQGKKMSDLICVKDTQIDFNFPQAANGMLAVKSTSSVANDGYYQYQFNDTGGSTLQFLNRDGVNQSFTLNKITLVSYSKAATPTNNFHINPDYQLSVTYLNDKDESVIVTFYLLASNTIIPSNIRTVIKKQLVSSFPELQNFYRLIKNVQGVTTFIQRINSLSLFNMMEFSRFYTQMSGSNCKTSFLLNALLYQLPQQVDPDNVKLNASPYQPSPFSQPSTTNLLCFGSLTNTGIFQTHMRDNYAHWAAWWSVLIFWISLLYGQSTTQQVFDERFKENKWTNWGMYSLFNLAHEGFFTRMMRTVPMYICFCWQGCVAAILYSQLYRTMANPTTIIIFGAISWAVSLPLQWIFGIFTKHHYNKTVQKLNEKRKLKNLKDKQGEEASIIEQRMENIDIALYSSYYWLYIFAFACFVTFWTLAINRLQQLPRQFYHLESYWLAALGVAWGLDNFVLDPLFSLILGGTSFYRFRPYYYNFQLGQSFKDLED